jgi:hypothetical protein
VNIVVIPVLELTDDTNMATTLKETLAQLEALCNEKVRAQNRKNGAGDNFVSSPQLSRSALYV